MLKIVEKFMGKISAFLSKAVSSYLRYVASIVETLPDGNKIKPWAELVAWPITLFAAIIGLLTAGAGLLDIFSRNISRLDDESRLRNSRANVQVMVTIDSRKATKTSIDGRPFLIIPVHLQVSNKSPHDYEIPFKSSRWVVNAIAMTPRAEIETQTEYKWTAEVGIANRDEIASGYAFLDYSLLPSEVLTRDVMVYVPEKKYTHLEAGLSFATFSQEARKELGAKSKRVFVSYSMDKEASKASLPPHETLLKYDVQVCSRDTMVMGQLVPEDCISYRPTRKDPDPKPIQSLGYMMRISTTEAAIE